MRIAFFLLLMCCGSVLSWGQTSYSMDSLKREIIELNLRVDAIDLRMERSKSRFQAGIVVSTVGYSTTIAGGLMLGRENDQLGQALLVAGGATGVIGTYLLTDAFRILGNKKGRKRR